MTNLETIDLSALSTVTGGDQAMVNGLSTNPDSFVCVKRSVGQDNMLGSKAQYACWDSTGRPASAGTFDDGVVNPGGSPI